MCIYIYICSTCCLGHLKSVVHFLPTQYSPLLPAVLYRIDPRQPPGETLQAVPTLCETEPPCSRATEYVLSASFPRSYLCFQHEILAMAALPTLGARVKRNGLLEKYLVCVCVCVCSHLWRRRIRARAGSWLQWWRSARNVGRRCILWISWWPIITSSTKYALQPSRD